MTQRKCPRECNREEIDKKTFFKAEMFEDISRLTMFCLEKFFGQIIHGSY